MSFLGTLLLLPDPFFLSNWCCMMAVVLTWSHTCRGSVVQPIINCFSCLILSLISKGKELSQDNASFNSFHNTVTIENGKEPPKQSREPDFQENQVRICLSSSVCPYPALFFQIAVSDCSSRSLSLATGPQARLAIFLRKLLIGKPLKRKERGAT